MTRRRAMVTISAAVVGSVLLTGFCAVAVADTVTRPAVSRDGWGIAIRVPGTAALNTGAGTGVSSVSCASPGNCSVVGGYATTGSYHGEVYVVSEVRGTWHKAMELPGLAALDKRHAAGVGLVSCPSPGNCGTGGSYGDADGRTQPFVANQVRGTWHKAIEVPGMAGLHALGGGIGPVSCPAPGDCAAAGSYSIHPFREQAFVVSQARGTWGKALAIPGLATLNTRHNAGVRSISCASPGNCTAVGTYETSGPSVQSFIVNEVNDTWGEAEEVPGTATLDAGGGDALVAEVSCTSPGDCTAIGTYDDPTGLQFPFVISQVNGTWGTATQIPGMTAFNKFGAGYGYSVSCASPGNCVAGGSEGADNGFDVGGGGQPFVANETNGTWGDARLVPGINRLNSGVDGAVGALSCPSAGNCAAAGYYGVGRADQKVYNLEVFVADEVNGIWGKAIEIPGTAALNVGKWASIGGLSCGAPGRCVVGGSYSSSHAGQAFVDSRS